MAADQPFTQTHDRGLKQKLRQGAQRHYTAAELESEWLLTSERTKTSLPVAVGFFHTL